MPTSNSVLGATTPGPDVVSEYSERVKGKIILITGANPGGVGGATATSLASASPKLLILAGRSPAKLAETTNKVKKANPAVDCKSLHLDLGSQASCRTAAKEILEDHGIPQIDLLINNAGVMNIPERTLSSEGIEMQFATNHIGHFLFTNLVFPKIAAAAKMSTPGATRIINLSSRAVVYSPVRFSDWNFTKPEKDLPKEEHMDQGCRQLWDETEDKPYIPQAAYGQSKTANVLFSVELNKKFFKDTGIMALAVHPGAINSELGRHIADEKMSMVMEKFKRMAPNMTFKDLDQGCSTTLVAALDPKVTPEEVFFADCQIADWAPKWSTDSEKANQLWALSEQIVGEKFTG